MIINGFKFGMLLQLAVGPMCLLVFNTSTTYDFKYGLYLMLAIVLVDALYIGLSCVGVASIINRAKVKTAIKLVGCFVLVLFGANTISGVFNLSFLPNIALFSDISSQNLFIQGLLLTASNPLTIVFWSSMFSTQMIENEWNKKQLFFFTIIQSVHCANWAKFPEQHTINGYTGEFLKVRQKTIVLQISWKRFMRNLQTKDTVELEMILNGIMAQK